MMYSIPETWLQRAIHWLSTELKALSGAGLFEGVDFCEDSPQ
jgi:hypothetical protein